MADTANHILLPWVAPGIAAHIPDAATETLSPAQGAAVSLTVSVAVNSVPIDQQVRLFGPGDIAGVDPQQVVRLEPRPQTPDFEPNYFPLIEFDRPDFPWLFTPLKADAQNRLRPWLCLVVVRKQPGVDLHPAASRPLPVLAITPPARPGAELPDLAESHFWAHAQVTGATKANLKSTLESQPGQNVSRLMCPRRLQPSTEYIACVVPAFEVGRKAGLGTPVGDKETLLPAWTSGEQAPPDIELPVYYSWEFRTGKGGDFEELVRRLRPRELPAEVGKRAMDIGDPGFVISPAPAAAAPGTVLGLEGALRVVDTEPDAWPAAVRAPFQRALRDVLNTPHRLATQPQSAEDPTVAPPIYGRWHAAVEEVVPGSEIAPAWPPPFWIDELNLDPRHRAVAAMGTRVIRSQQEQLMASAWEQLGNAQKINQERRQAQLSRAVNVRYHDNIFSQLPAEAFFQIVAPARSRVRIDDDAAGQAPAGAQAKTVLSDRLARSFVPSTAVSPALRKLTRPRGPINRHYVKENQGGVQAMFSLFNTGSARPGAGSRGAITIDEVSQGLVDEMARAPQPGFIWVTEPVGHWERQRVGYQEMLANFRLSRLAGATIGAHPTPPISPPGFRDAVVALHDGLSLFFTLIIFADPRRPMVMQDLKKAVMASLNPATTVSGAVNETATVGSPQPEADDLEPIMDAPTFPQPMYEALRDLSQDSLFPGLEHVPPNTVQVLQTNAKFIESFMAGLNHELARELLWRGYPTDQRGTYFQQFWDTSATGRPRLDVPPLHQWGRRALGTTAAGSGSDGLVLLIRGELLRRYPGTVIYAAKAVLNQKGGREPGVGGAMEKYPIFRGTLQPDVNFVGFDLRRADAVAGEGWFFIFQQQPTEPRFGLDDDPFGEGESGTIPALKTWNDLNWAHLAPSAAALSALSHVPVRTVHLQPTEPAKGVWERNSAHMAYITKQRLVRVAIHATEMLP